MNVADLITELQKYPKWFNVGVMTDEEAIVDGYAFNTVTRMIGHINHPEIVNLFVEPISNKCLKSTIASRQEEWLKEYKDKLDNTTNVKMPKGKLCQ